MEKLPRITPPTLFLSFRRLAFSLEHKFLMAMRRHNAAAWNVPFGPRSKRFETYSSLSGISWCTHDSHSQCGVKRVHQGTQGPRSRNKKQRGQSRGGFSKS